MSATSPYSGNDYQASQFRPTQLPVADIFKGVQVKNAYWDAAARGIKNQYEMAAGLDLTMDENKALAKEYLSTARENIKKLNGMNLSDGNVQEQASKLFTPLFSDEGIQKDASLTKLQKQIYSEALSYRNKDEGKQYSDTNLTEALLPFEQFSSRTTRGELNAVYEKAKNARYTPYHDVKEEFKKITSGCKPDKVSNTSVQNLYFKSTADNSQTASNLVGCITTGISEKALNQLRIEGRVAYHNNVAGLATDYISSVDEDNKAMVEMINELSATKKAMKDKGLLTPEVEKSITDQLAAVNTQINDNNILSAEIRNGNYSTIENNFDKYAAKVYTGRNIRGYASANAYIDREEKITANPVGMMQYKTNVDNFWKQQNYNLELKKFEHDMANDAQKNQLDFMKLMMDGGDGSGKDGGISMKLLETMGPSLGIDMSQFLEHGLSTGEETETGFTLEGIQAQGEEYHKARLNAGQGMYNVLQKLWGPEYKGALDKYLQSSAGGIASDSLYTLSQKLLENYYKPADQRDKKLPIPSDDIIARLEKEVNAYSYNSANVHMFMNMAQDAYKTINSDPQLQSIIKEYDTKIDSRISTMLGKAGGVMFYDPTVGKNVVFNQQSLKRIIAGTDPTYSFSQKDGRVQNKMSNAPLVSASKEITGATITGFVRDYRGGTPLGDFNYDVDYENPAAMSALQSLQGLVKEKREAIAPKLAGTLSTVIRNNMTTGISNVPGIDKKLKSYFSAIPELAAADIRVRPMGHSYPTMDGEHRQEVRFFRYNEKDKVEQPLGNDEIKGWMQNANFTQNGAFSRINFGEDGKILVDVSDLPFFSAPYSWQNVIDAKAKYVGNNIRLGNQSEEDVHLKRLPSGRQIGFTVRGTGYGNVYVPYIIHSDGSKQELGEFATTNQVGNVLMEVERRNK
jgi:hypothetical protein